MEVSDEYARKLLAKVAAAREDEERVKEEAARKTASAMKDAMRAKIPVDRVGEAAGMKRQSVYRYVKKHEPGS